MMMMLINSRAYSSASYRVTCKAGQMSNRLVCQLIVTLVTRATMLTIGLKDTKKKLWKTFYWRFNGIWRVYKWPNQGR